MFREERKNSMKNQISSYLLFGVTCEAKDINLGENTHIKNTAIINQEGKIEQDAPDKIQITLSRNYHTIK